jgi:hypothetical protein
MTKKLSILLILITSLLVFACCLKNFYDFYFEAKNIKITNTYNLRDIGDGVTISQTGYRIKCFLSEQIKKAISDINKGRTATGYCEDNFVGLKKDISNLKISCNKDIWNTIAGAPLEHNNIRFFEHTLGEDSENKRLTIVEWLNFINNEDQLVTFEWYMEFNEPIISNEFLKFTLTFEVEDGSQYNIETQSVKFE